MSTRMTKLTSQRAGRKAAEETEVLTAPDAESKLTASNNDNKGQSEQGSGTVKPLAAWTTSSQWVATSTAASGSGSRERGMGSGLADDAEPVARGNIQHLE